MMSQWSYGTAGDVIPVAVGDIWQVGPHVLACGDLERGSAEELLSFLQESPTVSYTDPPYTAALATGFRTKAAMPRRVDFPAFLARVVQVAAFSTRAAYLEMGYGNVELLTRLIREHQGHVLAQWAITYYGRHPACVVLATWGDPAALSPFPALTGCDDVETPALAFQAHARPGELVFDACVGRGLSAVAAHACQCRFVGLELHPRRLAVTLQRLERCVSGAHAQKIGTLRAMVDVLP